MTETMRLFAFALTLTLASSLVMLTIGSRLAGHRWLLRIGTIAHRKKLMALEQMWPLTRLRGAASRGDTATCTVILSALIILKSLASLAFGIAMVFWLPFASLIVPAVVAVHDPEDETMSRWVRKVSVLQVTSHALAAALGFAVVVVGPLRGESISTAIASSIGLFVLVSLLSLVFAVAAGHHEAAGVVERGI